MSSLQVQKTEMDQKQSLEVVQTMLHGGLSTLAYLRNFFGDKGFEEQIYDLGEKMPSYEDYAAGKLTSDKSTSLSSSTIMQILKRGCSRRVDLFLDWLENGVFTALHAGILHSLEIYVHPDRHNRNRVMEKYTFTIKYVQGSGDGRYLTGVELNSPGMPFVSVGATNKALQQLLRQTMKLCKSLPALPDQRFVTMEMFYAAKTSVPSPSKGWITSKHDKIYFAHSEGWERQAERLRPLHTGYHSTSLQITHLQQINEEDVNTDRNVKSQIPRDLQYTESCSKREDLKSPHKEDRTTQFAHSVDRDRSKLLGAITPSTIIETEGPLTRASLIPNKKIEGGNSATPTRHVDHPYAMPSKLDETMKAKRIHSCAKRAASNMSVFDDKFNTQSSNIPSMMQDLGNMMLPELLTQGDTQSQDAGYGATTRAKDSAARDSVATNLPNSTKDDNINKVSKNALRRRAMDRLESSKHGLRAIARQLARPANMTSNSNKPVLCQCSRQNEDQNMICCEYCATWQHLHCYGYTDANDERRPAVHVCYQCLLGNREEETLDKLRQLAHRRCGMSLALTEGLRTQGSFAREMGLSTSLGGQLYQHLKQQGYLLEAKGSRKAGHAASGKPKFVAVTNGPIHEKMRKNLFDPMMHISHHYESVGEPVVQSTLPSKDLHPGGEMPPPETPASQLRKRTQTPSTGLDISPSKTQFETPHPLASKRSRGSSEIKQPPSKRRTTSLSSSHRLRSVRTEFMIDVGDVSPTSSFYQGSN